MYKNRYRRNSKSEQSITIWKSKSIIKNLYKKNHSFPESWLYRPRLPKNVQRLQLYTQYPTQFMKS